MARTRRKAHTRIASDKILADMRTVQSRLVARIASAIQNEVEAYAGPVLGARRKLIEAAILAGMHEFTDRLSGKARPGADVDLLFRNLGHTAAIDEQTLEALRYSLDIATREVWEELHSVAIRHHMTASMLGRLGDALFEQVGHLRDQVEAGYQAGLDERRADVQLAREALARQLVDGTDEGRLESVAAVARWLLPELLLVVCMRLPDDVLAPEPALPVPADALVLVEPPYALWLCDVRLRDSVIDEARDALGPGLLSVSIPMPPAQVNTAARLARRAHQLTERDVIHATGTVDCADHEEELWLHAEPILRERMAERLLAPLAAETPHRRRMLGMTLLIWLEQRASAPAIAHQLGVHPQTVRHRLRQLDLMFDQRLSNPGVAFPTLLALKATLPSWIASAPADDQG